MSIEEAYQSLLKSGMIAPDPQQANLVAELERLRSELENGAPMRGLSRFFGGAQPSTRGLYVHGGVGRGKSFLMNLFFDNLQIKEKLQVHFHEFMDQMHSDIARFRAEDARGTRVDPVAHVVGKLTAKTRVLCFDEFHVTDITNAMLLGRLFTQLWEAGVCVVATSNVAPDELYKDGLNRHLILPFIDELKTRCKVINFDGETDYRRAKLIQQQLFYFGSGAEVRALMDESWAHQTSGHSAPSSIRSLGRNIAVPQASMGKARFDFADLCDQPLGARDYLALSLQFHTFMIDHIPQFTRENSNAAKRFIQLIDTLYERGVKLLASFDVPLDQLARDEDTQFEMQRCHSRLIEMQSDEYLARAMAPRQKAEA